MNDIDHFLSECVYYPCSDLHGVPIKFLGKRFQRFFYADYNVDRKKFDKTIRDEGLRGYQLKAIDELTPEEVFGMSWEGVERMHDRTISKIQLDWSNPFVVLCRFERAIGFDDDHGPVAFELMFTRCEAIATFVSVFSRRGIAPKCLIHVCSGVGFGKNFSTYPSELSDAVSANEGGFPPFIFYDRRGSDRDGGDYLDLVERYEPIKVWGYPDGGFLKLASIIAHDGV